jgi:uncharacterized RDD family membrane protein YckC
MSRSVLIRTPENVELEYELAGIANRFAAAFIDTIVQVASIFAFWLIYVIVLLLIRGVGNKFLILVVSYFGELSGVVIFGGILLFWIAYFAVFETVWNGQTPGKRVMALRVLSEGGYPISSFSAMLRNLLRVVDFLPLGYAAGIISIFVNNNYQRIGDLVGGTIVVKQRSPDRVRSLHKLLSAARITPDHLDREALALVSKDAALLTPDEYLAVRHFTDRRRELAWNAQQLSAMKIAVPLMERLKIVPPAGVSSVNYADFLEYLAVAYELERRPK